MGELESNLYELNIKEDAVAYEYSVSIPTLTADKPNPRIIMFAVKGFLRHHFPAVFESRKFEINGTTILCAEKLDVTVNQEFERTFTNRKGVEAVDRVIIQSIAEHRYGTPVTELRTGDATNMQQQEMVLNRIFKKAMGGAPFRKYKERFMIRKLTAADANRDRFAEETLRQADVWRCVTPTIHITKRARVLVYEITHRIIVNKRASDHRWNQGDYGHEAVIPLYDERQAYIVQGTQTVRWGDPMSSDTDRTFREHYTRKFSGNRDRNCGDEEAWESSKAYIETLKEEDRVPVLAVQSPRSSETIYLVARLCRMNSLDTRTRQGIPKLTGVTPGPRLAEQRKMAEVMSAHREETMSPMDFLNAWGISIQRSPMMVRGEDPLPPPRIDIPGASGIRDINFFAPALRDARLHEQAPIRRWIWLYQPDAKRTMDDLTRGFQTASQRWGMQLPGPPDMINIGPNEHTAQEAIKSLGNPRDLNGAALLVFINHNNQVYSEIKYLLARFNVVSQFVQTSKRIKDPNSYTSSIVLQTLCKLGHLPYTVQSLPASVEYPALFVGIDVFHGRTETNYDEGQRIKQKRSVIGLNAWHVAGPHPKDITTFGQPVETKARQEIMDRGAQFGSDLKDGHLHTFLKTVLAEVDQASLKSIIVFRDGVAGNQLDEVREKEASQVEAVIQDLTTARAEAMKAEGRDDKPVKPINFVFTVVQKRIAHQFINANTINRGRNGGHASAGTMIADERIVDDPSREFYLFSMSKGLSTNKSVRYHVVSNTTGIPTRDIAQTAYHLSHLYYVYGGAVKVPSMTQYAHQMAYQIGEHFPAKAMGAQYTTHRGLMYL